MHIRVSENVLMIGGGNLSTPGDCNVYLIMSKEIILIDTGLGRNTERITDNITEAGIEPSDIRYIVLTYSHIDHTGGAKFFRERFNPSIIAHIGDSEAIEEGDSTLTAANWYNMKASPVKLDRILNGDSGILTEAEPDLLWYHIPGHTPGSVALLYKESGRKILFGQDVHGPLSGEFGSDREKYRESLRKPIEIEADILCEGHYGIIKGQKVVKEFIRRFIEEN